MQRDEIKGNHIKCSIKNREGRQARQKKKQEKEKV